MEASLHRHDRLKHWTPVVELNPFLGGQGGTGSPNPPITCLVPLVANAVQISPH